MNGLVSFKRRVCDFPEGINIPANCDESIFVPTFSDNCKHHYYLLDFKSKKITSWHLDVNPIKEDFKNRLNRDRIAAIPWNKDLESYLKMIFVPHSAQFYGDKVYVSCWYSNFIVELDKNEDSFDIIYDASPEGLSKIYSSTNTIKDGIIYFSRWSIDDEFAHAKDRSIPVRLELGSFNVHKRNFTILDTIPGPDEIHDAVLCNNGHDLLFVEMGQDPVIEFPDFETSSPQLLHQVHDKGLVPSQVIVYNIKTKKYSSQVYPNAPGHAEASSQENIYYISQCNACNRKTKMFCMGNAKIDKVKIENSKIQFLKTYESGDFIRVPSHKVFSHNNKELLVCTVYPDNVHILDAAEMKLYKKIDLGRAETKADYFSNGAFPYPAAKEQKMPYTAHGFENKDYLFLTHLNDVMLFDFVKEKVLAKVVFNSSEPLIGMGHSQAIG